MTWINKVQERLDTTAEMHSVGSFAFRFDQANCCLLIAPALQEIAGGADDGAELFPFYSFNVSAFAEVFDKPPEILWSSRDRELSLEGKIGGDDAWIILRSEPFDDDAVREIIDPDGGVREK